MAGGPGGQDQTCRPITSGMLYYELGLRNYVKTSKFRPSKPWSNEAKVEHEKPDSLKIKSAKYNENFGLEKNLNQIRHILRDKKDLQTKQWSV